MNDLKRDTIFLALTIAAFVGAHAIVDGMDRRYAAQESAAEQYEEWLQEESVREDPLESGCVEQLAHADKRYDLTDEELYLVCGVVMHEAGGESYEGKMAVAQCILNNCERENARPADVAWKFAEPYSSWTDEVWKAVTAVFFEGQTVTEETILWFYAPALCASTWHESQRFVMEIGGHRFFAEEE